MRAIVVTGGNKGIGFGICEKALTDTQDTFVFLGSRDKTRGEKAVAVLREKFSPERVALLPLDVVDAESIAGAKAMVAAECTARGLTFWGLVNNAGGTGTQDGLGAADASSFRKCQKLNYSACAAVTDALLPLMGAFQGQLPRVVNVNSGAGPGFVKNCSEATVKLLTSPDATTADLDALVETAAGLVDLPDAAAQLAERGLGGQMGGNKGFYFYGFSKGLMNAWTRQCAKANKGKALVNSCSPGWVHTDLTQPIIDARGITPQEANMLTPLQGAKCPCYLLLDPSVSFTGRFYGSDAKRSPFHTGRDPDKDPEYEADPSEEI